MAGRVSASELSPSDVPDVMLPSVERGVPKAAMAEATARHTGVATAWASVHLWARLFETARQEVSVGE